MKTLKELQVIEHKKAVTRILEALLFASSEPLPLTRLYEIACEFKPCSLDEITELLEELKAHYKEEHSFQLDEIAGGYILRTSVIYGTFVEKLKGIKRTPKLSSAALEVLAIVANKQPITRSLIDSIRGVDSSQLLHTLVEKELIEQVGREESPGRPSLYGVTLKFLQHFGIKDCSDLATSTKTSL